ncbi:hypothetical protein Peur_004093 [Populus x canadensis]
MAATFLYALLTNRVLLVKHEANMTDLFCEAFPNTSWLLPTDFPRRNFSPEVRYASSFGSMLTNITNTSKESPESFLYPNLAHSDYDLDHLAFCDQNQALLQNIPWKVWSTIWVTIFATPSNQVGGLITRFYQAYLAKADDRIGLQIRVFHDKTTPIFQTVMDQILACVLKEKLLPEAVDTQEPIPSPSRNQTSKAILLTSLYSR